MLCLSCILFLWWFLVVWFPTEWFLCSRQWEDMQREWEERETEKYEDGIELSIANSLVSIIYCSSSSVLSNLGIRSTVSLERDSEFHLLFSKLLIACWCPEMFCLAQLTIKSIEGVKLGFWVLDQFIHFRKPNLPLQESIKTWEWIVHLIRTETNVQFLFRL